MGRFSVRESGADAILVIGIGDMAEVEKESRQLSLLGRRKSGDSMLNFLNAHNLGNYHFI